MDIEHELSAKYSKTQVAKIVNYVGSDPTRFQELMKHMLGPIYRLSQRASGSVSYCIERHPNLVEPYWAKLVDQLERDEDHVAVKRNVLRLLQFVEIPKRYQGRVFDACYNLFSDVAEPIAVRCFAMTVAAKIAKGTPELMAELKAVAAAHPEKMSAGFRSRVKRHFGI